MKIQILWGLENRGKSSIRFSSGIMVKTSLCIFYTIKNFSRKKTSSQIFLQAKYVFTIIIPINIEFMVKSIFTIFLAKTEIQSSRLTGKPLHRVCKESINDLWTGTIAYYWCIEGFKKRLEKLASQCGAAAERRTRDREVSGSKLACAIWFFP